VLAWAKRTPNDPRVPEALHLAVRSTRYGCTDTKTTQFSKQAFRVLHKQYPQSSWAQQTRYWYSGLTLAARAIIAAATGLDNALDEATVAAARFAVPAINQELILEVALPSFAIYVV
jgi:hypothetical protein